MGLCFQYFRILSLKTNSPVDSPEFQFLCFSNIFQIVLREKRLRPCEISNSLCPMIRLNLTPCSDPSVQFSRDPSVWYRKKEEEEEARKESSCTGTGANERRRHVVCVSRLATLPRGPLWSPENRPGDPPLLYAFLLLQRESINSTLCEVSLDYYTYILLTRLLIDW